jgi:hypothetical protein
MAGTNPCFPDESGKTASLKAGRHDLHVGMDLNRPCLGIFPALGPEGYHTRTNSDRGIRHTILFRITRPLPMKKQKPSVQPPFSYRGKNLLQIALPLGGIGAGSICLNGHGGLQDFSLRHKPNTTALQDGHGFTDSAFALLHLPESNVTKLVEGPLAPERIYDQGLQAQGYRKGGHEGFPRFRDACSRGNIPFGHVQLRDPKVPLEVRVTGFNPFIPLDDKNSGLPCAILEYALRNTSRKPVKYEFSYHLSHLACGRRGKRERAPATRSFRAGASYFPIRNRPRVKVSAALVYWR